MALIHGSTITLIERTQSGTDDFGQPTYTETTTTVSNVLVIADSESDAVSADALHGGKQAVRIGIPKGDGHNWHRCSIIWHGYQYDQTGDIEEAEPYYCPLDWDRIARAERYV